MTHFPPLLKKLVGRIGYAWTSTKEWLTYEFPPLEVEGIDAAGKTFRREATFLVAANTKRYSGNPILSPFADPEDDFLDVVLFTSASRVTLFRFYQLLSRKKAEQLSLPGVVRFPAREFTVRSLAGYEVEVQVDGEGCGSRPLPVGPALGRVASSFRSSRRRATTRRGSRRPAAARLIGVLGRSVIPSRGGHLADRQVTAVRRRESRVANSRAAVKSSDADA